MRRRLATGLARLSSTSTDHAKGQATHCPAFQLLSIGIIRSRRRLHFTGHRTRRRRRHLRRARGRLDLRPAHHVLRPVPRRQELRLSCEAVAVDPIQAEGSASLSDRS